MGFKNFAFSLLRKMYSATKAPRHEGFASQILNSHQYNKLTNFFYSEGINLRVFVS